MTRALPSLPHQLGVFTTEQALAAGWTEAALRNAVRARRADRLWRGVYAAPVGDGPAGRDRRIAQQTVAAALTNPGSLASHLGAAAVSGFRWWAPAPRPCLTVYDGAVSAVPGVHVHRGEVSPVDRWRGGAVGLTSPARTSVDVAREHGVEAGVVVGDAALQSGRVTIDDLRRATRDATGRPGVGSARLAVPLLDGRAESVLESRSRYRMHGAGVPAPWTQVDILTLGGRWLARVDFYWNEFGVVGECDGNVKYEGRDDVTAEKGREDGLRGVGLEVVRWGWRGLEPFEPTARKIWRAVDRGASRSGPRRWIAVPHGCGS